MRKTSQLKTMLLQEDLSILMEAHNGITAKLVEEAGFRGIWASGLTISASLGVRDNNEASWTQILDIAEFMNDATNIPILLDGDTGFGNFNNMRRLVKKLEQRGIAGVCIEDKLFPKTNSFINGNKQHLSSVSEFCGKIKAGKDTQKDSDFCIAARVEAFVAGWGLEEALKRAEAYAESGADAILIHSKENTPVQILSFMESWNNSTPVVIVPTTYCNTPVEVFRQAGVSTVIWANQTLRSLITSLQKNLAVLYKTKNIAKLCEGIAPVKEIFRLQNAEELKEAEKRYLPCGYKETKAVILAASQGSEFGSLTEDKPKAMISLFGRPILCNIIDTFNSCGIRDISVVVGYRKEKVNLPNINIIENQDFDETGILVSLQKAMKQIEGECVIAFGDVLFEQEILEQLLNSKGDIVICTDTSWCQTHNKKREMDLVIGSQAPSFAYNSKREVDLENISTDIAQEKAHGEWMGLIKLSKKGSAQIREELENANEHGYEQLKRLRFDTWFMQLMKKNISIKVLYVHGHWLDIDNIEDISEAYKMYQTY